MSGPATEFEQETPRVRAVESIRDGTVLHHYHGELEADAENVRIFTLAPEIADESVHDAFRRVAGAWHNPSSHPNVVTVRDRGTTPRPWLAVELPDGRPLDAVRADLSRVEIRTVVTDVAEALRNAALYNTTHLALEPERVWVTETADGPTAVVDDWGLERACRVAAGETVRTPFTAPELLDDPTAGTEQTDVYGLGALAYYALTGCVPSTGRPPTVSDEQHTLEAEIRDGTVTPPSELVADLPGAVDDVLLAALAPNPDDRYNSAYAVRSAFADALTVDHEDEPSASGPSPVTTDPNEETDPQHPQSTPTREGPTGRHSAPSESADDSGSLVTTRRAALALAGSGLIAGGGLLLVRHGGDSSAETPSADRAEWTVETGDWVYSSPAVADGTVYVGSDDDSLYALTASDGEKQWAFPTNGNVESSPAVADGTVYVGSDDGTLYAVDGATGDEVWSVRLGDGIESSPAVVEGTVYVGTDGGTVYALDTSGDSRWSVQTDRAVQSSPAIANDTVYVGTDSGTVYALGTTRGGQRWSGETGGQVDSSPAVVEGTVYVGSLDGNVYAFDATTGDKRWNTPTESPVQSSPAVVDGTLYVGSVDGGVYALSTADGRTQWRYGTGNPVNSSPAVVGDTVYVGSNDGGVYALDAQSGDRTWSYQTDDRVESSPAVVDGTVYVGSNDGGVYALSADASGDSGWPMFTYDSANTGHPGG